MAFAYVGKKLEFKDMYKFEEKIPNLVKITKVSKNEKLMQKTLVS
jgi:hypothetical protein